MKGIARTSAPRAAAAVVDLADARDGRRMRDLRARVRASVDCNKRVLGRLFLSGIVYTRAGARLGRELLLAHQHLLKFGDLLARLDDLAERREPEIDALARQIDSLIERTGELSARSDGLLAREP